MARNLIDMVRGFCVLAMALLPACAGGAPGRPAPAARPRVIIVSVDGLWAGDLARAESAGVRLPVLDSLRRAGTFAAGVIGSFPSVTYPSHTTMITGAPPSRHGVYANGIFTAPTERLPFSPSYWERDKIRVPTVFDAARDAGLRIAAVFWPVTAHDPSLHYNIPDAWDPRPGGLSPLAALRTLGTPWLLDSLGAPATGSPNDSMRVAWTEAIVRRWNPDLVALHVLDIDSRKHDYGPWNDSVVAALRTVDRRLGSLLAGVRATDAGRRTTVIVTSDHGFLAYRQRLRPGVLLAQAGLITVDSAAQLATSWEAAVHVNGGSVMMLPRDSTDPTIAQRIRAAIPDSLVGPGKPIRAVWPRDTIAMLGGDPRALWALDMNEGYYAIGGYSGPLLSERLGGGHGYDPRRRELHAFLVISGAHSPAITGRVVRQTEIAAIISEALGIPTPR